MKYKTKKSLFSIKCLTLLSGLLLFSNFSFAALNGTYTIDKNGAASATNYKTFASLFSDLKGGTRADGGTANGAGVTGPVIVNVVSASGPYTEQITVNQYTGVSSTNRITINGNGNTIQFTATVTTATHTILLDGADFVTFDNLVVIALSATNGRCFHLMNDARSNVISKCKLQMPNYTASTSITGAYVAITQGTSTLSTYGIAGQDNTITGNTMTARANGGPYAGIAVMDETTGTTSRRTTITNNSIRDFCYAGIFEYYTFDNIITGNEIFNNGNSYNSYTYGMYNYCYQKGGNFTISNNYIHDLNAQTSTSYYQYGIYHYAYYGTGNGNMIITNNRVNLTCNYYAYAMYIYGYYSTINGDFVCSNNTVDMIQTNTTNSSYLYGIYCLGPYYYATFTSSTIDNNNIRIRSPFNGYGLYAYNYYLSSLKKRSSISNNIIDFQVSGTGYAMLAYDYTNNQPCDVTYNTIYSAPYTGVANTGTKYLFYPYYVAGKIHNNLIMSRDNGGTTYGIYDYYYSGTYSNNNIFNAGAGTNFSYAKNGTVVATDLNGYKTNFGDVNALGVDPLFKSLASQDYTPTSFSFVNKGIPVTGQTLDIYAKTRNSSNPDIGAIEFFMDVSLKSLYFNGDNVCGGYREPVKVTLENKTADNMVNVPVMYTITGKTPVREVVPFIKSNDTVQYIFKQIAEFNGSGTNTIVVSLDGSDDNTTNNSLSKNLNITPSPAGFQLVESTTFPGYFRPGLTGGVITNPDATIPGKKVIYEVLPPSGYTNSGTNGYGNKWIINSKFTTANGTPITGPIFKSPVGSNNATLEFDPTSSMLDSMIYLNLFVKNVFTGCDSSFGRYIYIPHTPNASFNVSDVCLGDAAMFINKATLAKGIPSYLWKFNDPGTPEDSTSVIDPIFTFSTYGTYTVKLTAFRAEFPKFVTTFTKNVVVTPTPIISFKVLNACEREFIKITNNTTLPVSAPITYDWDFGDPTTSADKSTLKEPQWKYTTPGGYKIRLRATANGCNSELIKNANQFATPIASFKVPSVLCDKSEITFTNLSKIATGNMGYFWTFSDGNISTATNPVHEFNSSGAQSVKLKVSSEFGCVDSILKSIALAEAPQANFTFGAACNLSNTNFVFTGTKPGNGVTSVFNWDFDGEGSTSVESPSKLLKAIGKKVITLTITSNNGCSDIIKKEVNVKIQSKANFEATDICDGQNAVFTNTSTVSSGNLNYNWKFGDGSISASQSPRHAYPNGISKTYNVTLVAIVQGGCSDSISKSISVNATPNSDFTFTTSGRLVNYKSVQSGNTTYHWDFGDGASANVANAQYHYLNSFDYGKFIACLTVSNAAGCFSQTCKEIAITGGIDQLNPSKGLKVYPNPNHGNFTISLDNVKSDIAISVYSLVGELVKTIETNPLKSIYPISLDIADGVYIVKVTNGGLVSTQKITISK